MSNIDDKAPSFIINFHTSAVYWVAIVLNTRLFQRQNTKKNIWGSQGCEDADSNLLGYKTAWTCTQEQTFRRDVVHSSSTLMTGEIRTSETSVQVHTVIQPKVQTLTYQTPLLFDIYSHCVWTRLKSMEQRRSDEEIKQGWKKIQKCYGTDL
jgi:hypothetical protein